MASGIKIKKECVEQFGSLKKDRFYKYLIFKVNDDKTEFNTEHAFEGRGISKRKGEPSTNYTMEEDEELYEGFCQALRECGECRYAVYDFQYESKGQIKNKIVFFHWSPDTVPVKNKMIYSSSLQSVKQALQVNEGGCTFVQANDNGDLSRDSVQEAASKNDRM